MQPGDGIVVGDPLVRVPNWISVDDDRENSFNNPFQNYGFPAAVL